MTMDSAETNSHPSDDGDVAERRRPIEFDHSLLEQLQYGQEPHDDIDAIDKVEGAPERHTTGSRVRRRVPRPRRPSP